MLFCCSFCWGDWGGFESGDDVDWGGCLFVVFVGELRSCGVIFGSFFFCFLVWSLGLVGVVFVGLRCLETAPLKRLKSLM